MRSCIDAVNHLREKTGLRINFDLDAIMQMGMNPDDNTGQVTVEGTNEKASLVLRRLLNSYQLTYVVFEEAILITTEETAIWRQFRQRVSVDLEDLAFKIAVRDLAKAHGINLVIDSSLADKVEAKVSLQLDNTDLETTFRLLAEIAGLKAVPIGNVIFVTNEDKAKKIRDEDRQQLENVVNPPIPRAFNGGIRGPFGGLIMRPRGSAVPVNAGPPGFPRAGGPEPDFRR